LSATTSLKPGDELVIRTRARVLEINRNHAYVDLFELESSGAVDRPIRLLIPLEMVVSKELCEES